MTERDSGRRGTDDGLPIGRAYDRSRVGRAVGAVVRTWRSTGRPVAAESRSAIVVRGANAVVDRVLAVTADSAIVRWLCRPPHDDAIVVDLHDSVLFGPVLPRLRTVVMTVDDGFDAAGSHWNGSRMGKAIRERPLGVVGVTVLCLLGIWLATAWPDVTQLSLGVASVIAGAAILGTRADATAAALAETAAGRIVLALVLPPEDEA